MEATKKVWIVTGATGAAIGALNLAHYWVTAHMSGVEIPFGLFPGGFPGAAFTAMTGRPLPPNLLAMLVLGLGILAGAALSTWRSGRLTLAMVRAKRLTGRKALQAAAGGLLIGSGIWMAQGCLIKHALSGASGLMLSSWLTLAGVVGGIWLTAKVAERSS